MKYVEILISESKTQVLLLNPLHLCSGEVNISSGSQEGSYIIALSMQVHVKRELETLSTNPVNTQVKAFVGVVWHKSTEAQKKITKNIYEHMAWQIQELIDITVAEVFERSGTVDGTKVADEFLLK